MSTKTCLKIGARRSDLSRIQAYEVGSTLKAAFPHLQVTYRFKESEGDLDQRTSLAQFGGKGVFTTDLSRLLLQGDVDLVVHSWKDLPVDEPKDTTVLGTLPRADQRDVLLLKSHTPANRADEVLEILTSSPRREFNLQRALPYLLPRCGRPLQFTMVRGNVPTRIRKLLEGQADGLIVAKSALDRLLNSPHDEIAEVRSFMRAALAQLKFMILPLSENPCAPAQGALAMEVLRNNSAVHELIKRVSCPTTFDDAAKERAVLAEYGGGCHQKIGVSVETRPFGRVTTVRGMQPDGVELATRTLDRAQPPFPATTEEFIFPRDGERKALFERVPLSCKSIPPSRGLLITKAEALPDGCETAARLVWTAGVQTWRKLAERGVWVHGSADGLGEDIVPAISTLAGEEVSWLKLTHARGAPLVFGETYFTYALHTGRIPDLSRRTHFFWPSGSAFDVCVEKYPDIAYGFHGCGPGLTFRHLNARLGSSANLRVFLDEADWLSEVLMERRR